MFLVRDIMHCRPGKVSELVKRFKQMEPVIRDLGFKGRQRVLTDVSGDRYWTVIAEQEVDDLQEYLQAGTKMMGDPRVQQVMQGYHEFVDQGRREIFRIE